MKIVQPNLPDKIIDPPLFSYTRISISDPPDSRPILYNPSPSKVHTFNGRIWNSWVVDVETDLESPPLTSVRIEYLSERLAREKDSRLFIAGGLLGTGVSIFAADLLLLIRSKKLSKKKTVNHFPFSTTVDQNWG